MMKRNEGFTLLELIVSIAAGTIVTAAALTILLFGMRINAKTANSIKQLNATNMLTQVLQTVAEEPNIAVEDGTKILTHTLDNEGKSVGSHVFVEYIGNAIYLNGALCMEDVTAFTAVMENTLLTITIETEDNEYTSTVHCRMVYTPTPDQGGFPNES